MARFERPHTIAEGVYQHLRGELLTGDLPPGRWLREADLAQQLRVSRTPVREAVRQLAQEGLLVTEANRGVRVPELSSDEAVAAYEVRERLETMAARLAAPRVGDDERASLDGHLRDMEALAPDDFAAHIRADDAFHARIAGLAANPVLSELIERLNDRVMRVKILTRDVNATELARRQHAEIAAALTSRDAAAAEAAMSRHIRANLDIVVDRLRTVLPEDARVSSGTASAATP